MENTEITLNGTDWSNLYIIDYAGGCGGEKMNDFITEKIGAQFTSAKLSSDVHSCAFDSFDNLYITPLPLHLANNDISLYSGYKGGETNGLFHSEEMMKHNLKVNLIHRDEDMSQKMESSTEDERDSLVRSSHFDKNYILRSHRNINWSSFTNAKVIRIYPSIGSHLTYSLMMLKRWVQSDPEVPISDLGKFMSAEELEWITTNILSKTPDVVYQWQRELINIGSYKELNWWTFVEDSFMGAHYHNDGYERDYPQTANSIPAVEWVFGTDDSDLPLWLSIINDITGIDTSTDEIKTWQQANVDLLAEHGISMTSTKEECVDYFKNYWNLHNIPCVTTV
jgi:hypothetical protein|tara:strand:- start:338 stop:1351 length:1014 start_codon:yes stop_codon:yes gene_type:complete